MIVDSFMQINVIEYERINLRIFFKALELL